MLKDKRKLKRKEIKEELFVMSLLLKRDDVAFSKKFLLFLAISYAISPIDLLPDLIPFIGYIDDMFLIPIMFNIAKSGLDQKIIEEIKQEALNYEDHSLKSKWYYGIFTAVVFAILFTVISIYIKNREVIK